MELGSKVITKGARKQKRAYHRLIKDMNIKCCDKPMKVSSFVISNVKSNLSLDL